MKFIKDHKNVFIAVGVGIFCGLAALLLRQLPGERMFNAVIFNAVLLCAAYFIGAELARGTSEGFFLSLATALIPPVVIRIFVRSSFVFGYAFEDYMKFSLAAGAAVGLITILSRHREPLRSALGRNFIPGVAAAYGYFCSRGEGILLHLSGGANAYFYTEIVCFAAAAAAFLLANRKELLKLETYIALIVWAAVSVGAAWLLMHFGIV